VNEQIKAEAQQVSEYRQHLMKERGRIIGFVNRIKSLKLLKAVGDMAESFFTQESGKQTKRRARHRGPKV
jgi:hypothetical protein